MVTNRVSNAWHENEYLGRKRDLRRRACALRLVIAGSPRFYDGAFLANVLDAAVKDNHLLYDDVPEGAEGYVEVIHGGDSGVDSMAGMWAALNGHTQRILLADWDRHGRSADRFRNEAMLDLEPHIVVVLPDMGGPSPRTRSLVTESRKRGITVWEVYPPG